ncbi:MAG: 5-methylthioadenosine phosphorylase [Acidimicrobiaceae bacterium]|nr:5-methylthioadenosine phosphorylase [Acidimicrobiaceae bacterium]
MAEAAVGIFGGSGFYSFLDEVETHEVTTPYGAPSAALTIGCVAGRRVAFLPRHGARHEFAPHAIPYRANVHAFKMLDVKAILAPCAVGSLQATIHPGEMVVVDQLVDRTWGRADTYYDSGRVHHVAFADPYDTRLRQLLVTAGRALGLTVHDGGTAVVIQGPRFSTRAESAWFRQMGWSVVNMTGYPEAVLAAEAGIPYASVALVTDYDAGVDGHEPVTQDAVFAFFEQNLANVRQLLLRAIAELP